MKNRRNYYRILHVQPDAPVELIKSSYRTLMHKLKHHPDLGGDHDTAVIINEAYHTLTNAKKRQAYDAKLLAERRTSQRPTHPSPANSQPAHAGSTKRTNQTLPKDEKFDINTPPEQRAMPRVKLGALADFYFEQQPKIKHQGTIIDFSPSGLQIQIEAPVIINSKIQIQCQQLSAKGLISYCKPFGRDRWRIGVILLDTKYRQREGRFFRGDT